MTYHLTQAGANRLNEILTGIELKSDYTPSDEDFLLFAIGEKSSSRATEDWLLRKSGYYSHNRIYSLLEKGFITSKRQT